jgi:hypothetical protein
LKRFKFKQHTRVFEKTLEEYDDERKNKTAEIRVNKPFFKLHFASVGKLERKRAQIKEIIEKLGGKLSQIDSTTIAVISSQQEVGDLSKKIIESQSLDIHVVSESFLDDVSKTDAIKTNQDIENLVIKHSIASWGSDIKVRIETAMKTYEKNTNEGSSSRFLSNPDAKIKLKIKGGAIVDPETELEDEAHVLCEPKTNDPYSVILGMVDILKGTNSYYKLQIIQHDKYEK